MVVGPSWRKPGAKRIPASISKNFGSRMIATSSPVNQDEFGIVFLGLQLADQLGQIHRGIEVVALGNLLEAQSYDAQALLLTHSIIVMTVLVSSSSWGHRRYDSR